MPRTRPASPPEFRREAGELLRAGRTPSELAESLGERSAPDQAAPRTCLTQRCGRALFVRCGVVCAHAFVSIKRSPYAWFRAALQRGDLLGVRSAAADLKRIDLADAAAIVVLMATAADPAFERTAVKWVARLATERPYLALEDLADVVSALVALPHTDTARERLAALCARLGMGELAGLSRPKRSEPEPS